MGKRKTKKPSNIVTFDEEVIRKETASSLLNKMKEANGGSEETTRTDFMANEDAIETEEGATEGTKKRKTDASSGALVPKKKKKKNQTKDVNTQDSTEEPGTASEDEGSSEDDSQEIDQQDALPAKAGESKRALKRKKHAQLLEEKKLKAGTKAQVDALHYVSKWKHTKDEWKFEKIKQTWLQQHMFDTSRVPEASWENTVEYFCGSKGAIRKTITDAALKVIEESATWGESEDDEQSEEREIKLRRARDIVQRLV